MSDYQIGTIGRTVDGDGDLRRRLLAKIGVPLTASAAKSGGGDELSSGESVAADVFNSLVSDVYRAARRP